MAAEKDGHFSFEERKIKAWISQAQREIERREKQVEYLKRMSGNNPELRPAYHGHGHTPGYAHKAERLKQQIDRIKTGTIDKTTAVLKYSSAEARQKGNKLLTAFLYKDDMAQSELQKPKDISQSQAIAMKMRYGRKTNNPMDEKKTEKTLDASQDYAAKLLSDYREGRGKTPEAEKASIKDLDASQTYAMKLRYGAEEPGKGKAADQEKGAKKDMAASQEYAAKQRDDAKDQSMKSEGRKDISASQDYAQKLIDARQEQQAPGKEKADKGTAQKGMSMSASFSQRLDGTKSMEQDEVGKDDVDRDR